VVQRPHHDLISGVLLIRIKKLCLHYYFEHNGEFLREDIQVPSAIRRHDLRKEILDPNLNKIIVKSAA
jgi:hypothetical protein